MAQLSFWIVNPDPALARRWEHRLRREGWSVALESDLGRFAEGARAAAPGIVLLDWGALGFADAADSVRGLKAAARGLCVILTSPPGLDTERIISALEAGADDHMPRDIDERLFMAKLKAHSRRMLPSLESALDVLKSPAGSVKLDRSRQEVWIRNGRAWASIPSLTPTEFQFLTLFLEQPGKVLERRFIVETVWRGEGPDIRLGTVDKHIESLRRKLGRLGGAIRTVYGVGYAFRDL